MYNIVRKCSLCGQSSDVCVKIFSSSHRGPPKRKENNLTNTTKHRAYWDASPRPSPQLRIGRALRVLVMLWLCSRTICVFARHLGDKGIQTLGKAGMADRWLGQRSSDVRAAWKTKAISTFHTAWGFSQRRKKFCRLLMDMVFGSA